MALVSDLVEAIAEVEDLPLPTVQMVARHLREAGLLSTGARGRNAPAATVTDAANLLIAVNANGCVVKDAPTTVLEYRGLVLHVSDGPLLFQWVSKGDGYTRADAEFHAVGFLREAHLPFGAALEGIIDGFVSDEIPNLFTKLAHDLWEKPFRERAVERIGSDEEKVAQWVSKACESYIGDALYLRMEFFRPQQNANFSIGYNDAGDHKSLMNVRFIQNVNRLMEGHYRTYSGDRHEQTTIGYKTLIKISEVLKS